ncbi:MAG: hypothetical protein KDD22_02415, partial [Bdellovibrionales bacterium]|nr:hypothetical protein [Bdellovibrionales bacterium]
YLGKGAFEKSFSITTLKRIGIVVLPTVIFLAWNVLFPLPPSLDKKGIDRFPQTGKVIDDSAYHPYLDIYGAHPIDFISGDLGVGFKDFNPIKEEINNYIRIHLEKSNLHERSHGIRWWVLGLALLSLLLSFRRTTSIQDNNLKHQRWFFAAFGLWAFLLALSPQFLNYHLSPAFYLHQLISQFRVPNRAGIFVHFAMLYLAGDLLNTWFRTRPISIFFRFLGASILCALAVLSLPFWLNPMPISRIQPPYPVLTVQEECGTGIYFPYISGTHFDLQYYYMIQRLRGSHCSAVNRADNYNINKIYLRIFPLHNSVLKAVNKNDPTTRAQLKSLFSCMGFQWIIFDEHVSESFRKDMCQDLKWNLKENICYASFPHSPLKNTITACVSAIGD